MSVSQQPSTARAMEFKLYVKYKDEIQVCAKVIIVVQLEIKDTTCLCAHTVHLVINSLGGPGTPCFVSAQMR